MQNPTDWHMAQFCKEPLVLSVADEHIPQDSWLLLLWYNANGRALPVPLVSVGENCPLAVELNLVKALKD